MGDVWPGRTELPLGLGLGVERRPTRVKPLGLVKMECVGDIPEEGTRGQGSRRGLNVQVSAWGKCVLRQSSDRLPPGCAQLG